MAYKDPYAGQHGRYDSHYTDAPDFNPYNNAQPHQAYDQGGYDSYAAPEGYMDDANNGQSTNPGGRKIETTQYDQGAFARGTTGKRFPDLRHWRYEHHRGLWGKGSRVACIGRFCCCTIMIIVFFIVGIILPLALWARPPNIVIGSVQTVSNGSEIQTITDGLKLNLQIPIQVSNPNYFSVSLSSIKANIYYPINNTLIGGGQENGITFDSHSNTNFTFPFSIEYTTTMPSSAAIIADLLSKCGSSGSDITVNYEITLGLRIVFFTVSPTISNSASFVCPLTSSEIGTLTSALGSGL